ncbi:hypothetical protein Cpir12675_000980 [Ceratocystis pirilliformis]|uniref:Delta 8-(E)-sphingolipid desaturase n=1 Tax=Ceratocystis pirilliformis TaxID=259994 RepID=A0ABR3ZI62_9PEZI
MAPTSGVSRRQREYPIMTPDDVKAQITKGHSMVIFENYVLKIDAWIPYHPGGDLAVYHMIGRDATDEMVALHSPEARAMMARYRVGRIEGRWTNLVPPISGGKYLTKTQPAEKTIPSSSSDSSSAPPSPTFDKEPSSGLRGRKTAGLKEPAVRSVSVSSIEDEELKVPLDGMTYLDLETKKAISIDLDKYPSLEEDSQAMIVDKYRELHEKVKEAGLYKLRPMSYVVEFTRYIIFFLTSMYLLHLGWYCSSALVLGIFWHQLSFFGHDSGHMAITQNFTIDTLMGIMVADFVGGLSLGWWKWSHNVHHIVTNHPEHDPDNQHLPFLAVSHRFFENLWSTYHNKILAYDWFAQKIVRWQAYLYYPILALGRFNLYIQGLIFLIKGTGPTKGQAWWCRWLEIVGMTFFWYWFGYCLVYKSINGGWNRLAFVLISHMATTPLHLQITLSHFAMSTMDLGPAESFPQKMMRTTMDIDCPQWMDFVHGGLQFQAVHHLFPRIPRHNLRDAQKLVFEFCKETKIPYAFFGFTNANVQMIGHLADVARQGQILAKCKQSMIDRNEILGYHH